MRFFCFLKNIIAMILIESAFDPALNRYNLRQMYFKLLSCQPGNVKFLSSSNNPFIISEKAF